MVVPEDQSNRTAGLASPDGDSVWFAGKNEYSKLCNEAVTIREILHK